MKFPVILGNDLLDQAELIVNRNGVQILKSNLDTDASMAAINFIEETELDIGKNVCEARRREIKACRGIYTD